MTIHKIKSILDDHGVPNYIVNGRIYADSMIASTDTFEVVEDLTNYSRAKLYAWLGY